MARCGMSNCNKRIAISLVCKASLAYPIYFAFQTNKLIVKLVEICPQKSWKLWISLNQIYFWRYPYKLQRDNNSKHTAICQYKTVNFPKNFSIKTKETLFFKNNVPFLFFHNQIFIYFATNLTLKPHNNQVLFNVQKFFLLLFGKSFYFCVNKQHNIFFVILFCFKICPWFFPNFAKHFKR